MSDRDPIQGADAWPDDEVTQPETTLASSEADAVCAAWMQRGRELAERRDQTVREAA